MSHRSGATNGLFSSSNIFDNLTCHLGQNLFRHHLRWVRLKIEIESTGPATNSNVVIVGLPRTTVKKSRDRVTTAIARGGYFGRAGKGKSMSPWPILKGTNLLTDCAWHDRGFPCPLVRANSGHAMTIIARSPSPSLAPRTEPLRYYLVHPY